MGGLGNQQRGTTTDAIAEPTAGHLQQNHRRLINGLKLEHLNQWQAGQKIQKEDGIPEVQSGQKTIGQPPTEVLVHRWFGSTGQRSPIGTEARVPWRNCRFWGTMTHRDQGFKPPLRQEPNLRRMAGLQRRADGWANQLRSTFMDQGIDALLGRIGSCGRSLVRP